MSSVNKSPSVTTREIDLTATIPMQGVSTAAFVGDFSWGAIDEIVQVSSEELLVNLRGKPTDRNYISFFACADFLAYASDLQTLRVVEATAKNATSDGTGLLIKNRSHYNMINDGLLTQGFAAKYAGIMGNGLRVSIADQSNFDKWEFADEFDAAPATSEYAESVGAKNDEVHVVIVDSFGTFTGTPNAILETYSFLSKAVDAKGLDGAPIYYMNAINEGSKYVYALSVPETAAYDDTNLTAIVEWGKPLIVAGVASEYKVLKPVTTENHVGYNNVLTGGDDGQIPTAQELIKGWTYFKSTDEVDVGLLITGDAGFTADATAHKTVVQFIIDNLADNRQDCVVCYSPKLSDVLNKEYHEATTACIKTRQDIGRSSSYAVMDSGWKYRYDVYNDKYRWLPLNADIAGLMAMTENDYDAWWSPAGFNRGKIKNCVALAWSPDKDSRDDLYKNQINPVVNFKGDGTILYGDKTQQAKSSAFQFINVRRLFITLRKSISQQAKYLLFEFNDEFTRAQFRNTVEPFMRQVKSRRGVNDYYIRCDSTNNTAEVIDNAEFVGDIFAKPNRSINWIRLNFVAVRNSVAFSEYVNVQF